MGHSSNLGDKITIKALLICILISMWLLGMMILGQLKEPVRIDTYYGSIPVAVENQEYELLEVKIINDIYEPIPVEAR